MRAAIFALVTTTSFATPQTFRPGEIWPEDCGKHIQAHGGGVIWLGQTSLAGPWSKFKDIAPPETKTYGSQSTMLLKVVGSRKTAVLFLADIWKPAKQWDSRDLWMPLEIDGGRLWLPAPASWTLGIETGEAGVCPADAQPR